MTDREIIKALGGVASVAKLCGISQPAVTWWNKNGIPKLRMIQLKHLKPEFFNEIQAVQPTTTIRSD